MTEESKERVAITESLISIHKTLVYVWGAIFALLMLMGGLAWQLYQLTTIVEELNR